MTTTQRGQVRVEPGYKRVRATLNGETVFDTTRPWLVWESAHFLTYYVPIADVHDGVLTATGEIARSPSRGDAQLYTVKVGDTERVNAARIHTASPFEDLRDAVRLEWDAMDGWFEEDEEIFVHPRSPHTRVDILPSSRSVRVEIEGVVLAESTHAHALHETGLPVRWYLPKVDVRFELLSPTDTTSGCPYKGFARYWSADVNGREVVDIAWAYPNPLRESQRIAGLVCFYNEKVDLYLDGELQAGSS